eukprot:60751-Pelagomonas_calceolata.AAC.3
MEAEKRGFSNLHQMTSAPGLKLLLGRLIILQRQVLRGALGELAGGGSHRESRPMDVGAEGMTSAGLQQGQAGRGPSFRTHICQDGCKQAPPRSCCLRAAPHPALFDLLQSKTFGYPMHSPGP